MTGRGERKGMSEQRVKDSAELGQKSGKGVKVLSRLLGRKKGAEDTDT